jgi:type I restriction enzyme S subunit
MRDQGGALKHGDTAGSLFDDLEQKHLAVNRQERPTSLVAESMREFDPGALPSNWRVVSLRLMCDPTRPITYGILKPGPNIEAGVPYVRVTDFKSGIILRESLKRTSQRIAQAYRRSARRSGDLLFAIRGTFGHVAVVPPELEGANITQDTARLSIDASVFAPFRIAFVEISQRTGSSQARSQGRCRAGRESWRST